MCLGMGPRGGNREGSPTARTIRRSAQPRSNTRLRAMSDFAYLICEFESLTWRKLAPKRSGTFVGALPTPAPLGFPTPMLLSGGHRWPRTRKPLVPSVLSRGDPTSPSGAVVRYRFTYQTSLGMLAPSPSASRAAVRSRKKAQSIRCAEVARYSPAVCRLRIPVRAGGEGAP
jgi:hypothetical protein